MILKNSNNIDIPTNSNTFSILLRLMEKAHQIAQSQDIVNLRAITVLLSKQIQQLNKKQIVDLINISDFLIMPLISNACAHALVTNSSIIIDTGNIRNFFNLKPKIDYFFDLKLKKTFNNLPLFDNVLLGNALLFNTINKLFNLNPKDLKFYEILKKINNLDIENFVDLLIFKSNDKFFISNFLDQIKNPEITVNFQNCLYEKIKNILIDKKLNAYFYLPSDLWIKITPKKFLYLLLILPHEDVKPFLHDLRLLIQNNLLIDYDLALAQALIYLNDNTTSKDSILDEFGFYEFGYYEFDFNERIGITKCDEKRALNLENMNLGDPENFKKFLFFIAVAQILKIESLILKNNELRILPAELGNLINLERLNLAENQFLNLPPTIGNLANLTDLDLSDNQLIALPPTISNLTNLAYLYLGGNQLRDLPPEFGNLIGLENLELNNNQIRILPSEFTNLTELKYLNFKGNPNRIPKSIRKRLQQLKKVLQNNCFDRFNCWDSCFQK